MERSLAGLLQPSDDSGAGASRMGLKVLLWGLGCVAVGWLLWAGENYRGEWAWRRLRANLIAKGERLDWSDLTTPEVPEDQDFLRTPLVAAWVAPLRSIQAQAMADSLELPELPFPATNETNDGMVNLGDWAVALRAARQAKADREARAANLPDDPLPLATGDPAADVLAGLSVADPVLAELCEASLRPYADYPLGLAGGAGAGVGFAIYLETFLQRACQVLALRAEAHLRRGEHTAALAAVLCGLRLVDKDRAGATGMDRLLRGLRPVFVLHAVWEGLVLHQWNDEELAALQRALSHPADMAVLLRALECERASANATLEGWVASGSFPLSGGRAARPGLKRRSFGAWFQDLLNQAFARYYVGAAWPGQDRPWFEPLLPAFGQGWLRQNQCRLNARYTSALALVRAAAANPASPRLHLLQIAEGMSVGFGRQRTPYDFAVAEQLMQAAQAQFMTVLAEACSRLAETSCALERCRLADGAYPESLAALVPRFLPALPLDPINAQPLRYRRLNDGTFKLYSVGADGKDDNGGSARDGPSSGEDWLWPTARMLADRRLL